MEEELTKSHHANRYRILTAVMLGGIMGPIDASVINVNYHIIGNHFGVALTEAQWVVMVYLLTVSSLLLFYGRLGDILGYKKIYLIGLS
ncbi:MAG: MFS transporter, partial [Atribacterota bacterium]|nr:MFS transporter [Atribacterota bacterium]